MLYVFKKGIRESLRLFVTNSATTRLEVGTSPITFANFPFKNTFIPFRKDTR